MVPLLLSSLAHACGGFFCNGLVVTPVYQAAERILFQIDPSDQTVRMSVQITYAGDPTEFAWIVPVPAEPDLSTDVDDVFDMLADATRPTFTLTRDNMGVCYTPPG